MGKLFREKGYQLKHSIIISSQKFKPSSFATRALSSSTSQSLQRVLEARVLIRAELQNS